jgi:hypothetical protein
MFRFREFRQLCRNNDFKKINLELNQLIKNEDVNNLHKSSSFISELINRQYFSPDKELLQTIGSITLPIFTAKNLLQNQRVAVLLRAAPEVPLQFIHAIDRLHFSPIVILCGNKSHNAHARGQLEEYRIPCQLIDMNNDLKKDLITISQAIEDEHASTILAYANPFDLDFKVLANTYKNHFISFHDSHPLLNERSISKKNLGHGSWQENRGLPLSHEISLNYLAKGKPLPAEIVDFALNNKLCLLNEDPLEVLNVLDDQVRQNINFVCDPNEFSDILYYGKELVCTETSFQQNLDLAMQYGLSLKALHKNKTYSFTQVVREMNWQKKFKKEFNSTNNKKCIAGIKTRRILYFRDLSSAPIIREIDADIISALKHLSCPVLVVDISKLKQANDKDNKQSVIDIQKEILKQIKNFKPEEALGYNDIGIFPSGESHFLESMNIPYNALFFDNPFYFMSKLKLCKNKDLIRIFCFDRYYVEKLKEHDFQQVHYFPIATGRHITSYKSNSQFNHRLLFAATIKPQNNVNKIIAQVTDESSKAFLSKAWPEITSNEVYEQKTLTEKYSFELNNDNFCQFQNTWFKVDNLASSELRRKTVEALKDYEMDIFGGDNWRDCQLSPNHQYRGYLNYKQLPAAVRQAKLTICRSPLNIQNGIQQRILDCGALQGLILTDYRSVLKEHFKLDEELYVYKNCDELQDKVKFLLSHPKAVTNAITALHKTVLKKHTWNIRVAEWLNVLSST